MDYVITGCRLLSIFPRSTFNPMVIRLMSSKWATRWMCIICASTHQDVKLATLPLPSLACSMVAGSSHTYSWGSCWSNTASPLNWVLAHYTHKYVCRKWGTLPFWGPARGGVTANPRMTYIYVVLRRKWVFYLSAFLTLASNPSTFRPFGAVTGELSTITSTES